MKHLFIPNSNGKHIKDGVRGTLHSFSSTANVRSPHPILETTDGITDYVAPPAPAPVPTEIANWRAKAVLAQMGLLAAVDAALAALPEPQKTVVGFAWGGDAKLLRNSPTVLALGTALQLDAAALDDFFRAAAAIEI